MQLLSKKNENKVPGWLSQEAYATLADGYLQEGEEPADMYARLAGASAGYLIDCLNSIGREKYRQAIYECLWRGWLSPATPVASNFGTNRALPVSCFLSKPKNSINGIYRTKLEMAMLSKNGGGLGVDVSDLIGESPVTHWAQEYDLVARAVSQNGIRRGSVAIYCDADHPDVHTFLQAKDLATGDPRNKLDCNIALKFSDNFMHRLLANEVSAKETWAKALELRMKMGSPYMFFTDNVQRADPACYKANGLATTQSNLCLVGETLVATKQGPRRIDELAKICANGESVEIFDGESWVQNNSFRQTGTTDELMLIELKNGVQIQCTPEHKFITKEGEFICAKDLKKGKKLAKHNEQFNGNKKLAGAYAKGFMVGDGCYAYLAVYKPKYCCIPKLEQSIAELQLKAFDARGRIWPRKIKKIGGWSEPIPSWKSGLPDEWVEWDYESKCEFLAGLFDADACGYVWPDNRCASYQFSAKSLRLCEDVVLMLRSIGIRANLIRNRCRVDMKPEFVAKRIKEHYSHLETVAKIEKIYLHESKPVYCCTVPTTHAFGLTNGVMSGNCNEIFLHTDPQHTAVCVLSSLNLNKLDEWYPKSWLIGGIRWTVPMLATTFCDTITDEFIAKGKLIDGIESAVRSAEKGRALGLGVFGLHAYYQQKGLAFDDGEAFAKNKQIFAYLQGECLYASQQLAKMRGEPEWCKGFGIRNTHRMAIAPTLASSVICNGGSPGVEPIKSNIYTYQGAKGTFVRKNRQLARLLHNKYHKNDDETWESIREADGSVQHLEWMHDCDKLIYRTAFEIPQDAIIEQAADRQQFIDQGQSVNIFIRPDESADYISYLHLLAWKLGMKGLYYLRSKATKVQTTTLEAEKQTMQQLNELAMQVHLQTRADCAFCQSAKMLLAKHGIAYSEEHQPIGRVPVITINGRQLADGYSSLKQLLEPEPTQQSADTNECKACDG